MIVKHTKIKDFDRIKSILEGEGFFNIFLWRDSKGTFYDTHTHPHYELRWVIEGSIIIRSGEKSYVLKPGDRFETEPLTPHSAEVLEEVVYVCASR